MNQKIMLVDWHIKKYLQAKILIESSISNITQRPHVIDFYRYIQFAIDRLDEDSKTIIFNDFMAKKNHNWYLEFYSLSTYYRLRKIAVNKFLDCLHGL
jgi:hypothetical protein